MMRSLCSIERDDGKELHWVYDQLALAEPDAWMSHCAEEEPKLRELRPNHYVACHYAGDFP